MMDIYHHKLYILHVKLISVVIASLNLSWPVNNVLIFTVRLVKKNFANVKNFLEMINPWK